MKVLAAVRIALRALRVNRLRSALTMLGIIIGVAAVIAMVAVGSGATKRIQEQIQAIVNLVAATERATAIALGVFVIHILGDALSPFLIGELSDAFSLGQAVKIVPIAVVIGACIWGWAARAQARADEVAAPLSRRARAEVSDA